MNGKDEEDEEEKGEERKSGEKEDHEDGCFRGDAGDARGEEELRQGARTVEVKRNVNGRKSGWASMDEEAERH